MDNKKMMNLAKKRGFLWSSFEIYSGVSGFYDYGPIGAILKNNIMQKWREQYIAEEEFYEIESPTVMPKEPLKASGHVDNFTDPMTKCDDCGEVYRADHVIEEQCGVECDGFSNEELDDLIKNEKIICPECSGSLSNTWNYNLMFKTSIGAKGDKVGYMRPETAQGIFIPFKRLLRFFRNKLPFGVVQLGKAYRNEISPRQGVIRLREFTQAELEIFVNPEDKKHYKFNEIKDEKLRLFSAENQEKNKDIIEITAEKALNESIVSSELLLYQIYLAKKFLLDIGIPEEAMRFRQHLSHEMAHYAIDCWDVEIATDQYGWVEVIGIADRGDYDLKSHMEHSGEDMRVFLEYDEEKIVKELTVKPNMSKIGPIFKKDAPKLIEFLKEADANEIKKSLNENGSYSLKINDNDYELNDELIQFTEEEKKISGEKILPHVIEPSFGIDRIFYSLLLHSFVEKSETKNDYLKLKKEIAPIQVSVFPLVNKEKLAEIALDIKNDLRADGIITDLDSSGTIGRRYARCDEIGVPIAITVDFDTLDDQSVTLRDRDSEKQVRIAISNIKETVKAILNSEIEFEDLMK